MSPTDETGLFLVPLRYVCCVCSTRTVGHIWVETGDSREGAVDPPLVDRLACDVCDRQRDHVLAQALSAGPPDHDSRADLGGAA